LFKRPESRTPVFTSVFPWRLQELSGFTRESPPPEQQSPSGPQFLGAVPVKGWTKPSVGDFFFFSGLKRVA